MNILLIEDEPTDRKLAGVVLKTSGHIVREMTSAEEAIEAIAADPPELILLDLKLPGINGLELIRKLKESSTTRDIPIVVMTAFPEWFEKNKTLAAGCDAYFVKPLNTRTLSQQVAEVVARKAQGE